MKITRNGQTNLKCDIRTFSALKVVYSAFDMQQYSIA